MNELIYKLKSGQLLKDRRMRTILLAITFTLAFCIFVTANLFAGSSYVPEDNVQELNYERSQVYVNGTGYVLDSYDKKQHKEEEEEQQPLIQQEQPEKKETPKTDTTNPFTRRYNTTTRPSYTTPSYSRPSYTRPSYTPPKPQQSTKKKSTKKKKEKESSYNKNKEEVDLKPTIKISGIKNGQTVKGTEKKFKVNATSYDGDEITGSGLVVMMNGDQLTPSGDVYVGEVIDGENEIKVTAKDGEGNKRTKTITFDGETSSEPEDEGELDVSVGAEVLGLDDILGGSIVFKDNESVKDAVDRCIKENGATPKWEGGYLVSIKMDGILDDIPEEIIEELEEQGISVPDNKDALGEFDFGPDSGWKYRVNGKEPSKMMSEVDPEDGDTVELFYTISN